MTFSTTVNCDPAITFGISQEQLQAILRDIESELYQSKVYRIARANLRKRLGDSAKKGDILIRAIGREAIQLAVKNLVQQSRLATQMALLGSLADAAPEPATAPEGHELPTEASPAGFSFAAPDASSAPFEVIDVSVEVPVLTGPEFMPSEENGDAQTDGDVPADSPDQMEIQIAVREESEIGPGSGVDATVWNVAALGFPAIALPKIKRKPTKAELAAQQVEQRNNCIRQIGQELQQARQALSLSLLQLHQKTLVPVSNLEALEQGEVAKLPQDIYIRGLIRRVGATLGLDGNALAAMLPEADSQQFIDSSWSKLEPEGGIQLNSVHLYLGYAAVLAGSLSGVAWLAQQSVPDSALPPDVPDLAPETSKHSQMEPKSTPGLRSATANIVLGADIAPPQRMEMNRTPQGMTSVGFSSYSFAGG
ncbi:MAG: hypothetical protein HC835_07170 [Oscillatoriales cyanobacterium RM2_1_1]|nr:hypothetical protein [Oscillatoriales cyanobacterium SM2_3_0]NJO45417.1 hypothetical protein [Oscillatoriales cyanobacterium RM2_1_1]